MLQDMLFNLIPQCPGIFETAGIARPVSSTPGGMGAQGPQMYHGTGVPGE